MSRRDTLIAAAALLLPDVRTAMAAAGQNGSAADFARRHISAIPGAPSPMPRVLRRALREMLAMTGTADDLRSALAQRVLQDIEAGRLLESGGISLTETEWALQWLASTADEVNFIA